MLGSLLGATEKNYFQRLLKLKKNFLHLNISMCNQMVTSEIWE